MTDIIHQPVLLTETLGVLRPKSGEHYLDLTAGYGGHASEVLRTIGPEGRAVLVDRDEQAINHLKEQFKNDQRVTIVHEDYLSASRRLAEVGEQFDVIMADIGVSSPHLDNPDRGFSFMNEGPLDMRMDTRLASTAAEIVNHSSEEELADILYKYGELHNSRQLARRIVQSRPFTTTNDLASIIPGSFKQRPKILAQVFQALRIVVNDELHQLSASLPLWHKLLNPGGRLAVISFHSLEDRIIKQFFQEHAADTLDNELILVTKRPLTASPNELAFNPRARSAKLRCVQRK